MDVGAVWVGGELFLRHGEGEEVVCGTEGLVEQGG